MRLGWLAALALTSCMVGPDYRRPPAARVTAGFKEAPPGWTVAQPQDAAPKGEWWSIYHDPLLDQLERRVVISNQNVQQFEAQYREAAATVDIARSALFPTVTATGSATRSLRGGRGFGVTNSGLAGTGLTGTGTTGLATGGTTTTGLSSGSGGAASNFYSAQAAVNWDLDVWGRIRRQVESDVAAAQVSAADLANAALSAQALLATDYFGLRAQDALGKLLTSTVGAYADALRIAQNQYNAGTANPSDVADAQTQLDTARASLVNVGVLRAQYEHAVAVPAAPDAVPSVLLQRRPDVAAAERAMRQETVYTNVITQQTLLLGNQETALAVQQQRLVASVALAQALGGGFDQADLPTRDDLERGLPFLK